VVGAKNPESWRLVELGEVCELPKRHVQPSEFSKHDYYVGLEHIEGDRGRILTYESVAKANLKSSKFPFDESCVLYGKLRPYLNKVALPDRDGLCSTDILPLRPDQELLLKEFLFYFLRTRFFVETATSKSTGANLPRITPSSLVRIAVPLPSLDVQRRVVGILQLVDRLRNKRDQANKLTNKVIESIFLKMFGDPATNPKGWPVQKLGSVCSKVTDGTHITPKYVVSGVPFLSVKDVRNGYLDFSDTKFISQQEHQDLTRRNKPEFGDVLYTKVGSVGIAALVNERRDFSIFVSVALLKPIVEIVDPKFLTAMLNTRYVRSQASRRVKGIGVPDLHLVEIKDFDIIVPSLQDQKRFVRAVDRVEKMRSHQEESTQRINELFHSLMDKAFRGELKAG